MKSSIWIAMFLGVVLISGTLHSQTFADVISPKQQIKLNFSADQVICGEGLVKVFKISSSAPSCVTPSTAEKLSEYGWAKKLSAEDLEEIRIMKLSKGEPVGKINKIAVLKQLSKNTKAGTSTSITGYAFVFDACAKSTEIRTPEIIVTSDSETHSVKLGSMLKPNSCYTTSVLIKAANPDSITGTMVNMGGVSDKIITLENKIAELKNKINTAKQKIPVSSEQKPDGENLTSIISMKKELQSFQDELRRYLMVLYVPSNLNVSQLNIPKTLTGKPLEGLTTELISVTESVLKPETGSPDLKRYNVVFEACSGKDTIRLPLITVSSDSESVDVKFIDKIIPNSCQVGITRINAIDSDSIVTTISENSGVSTQIADLEKLISDLETQLGSERTALNKLVSKQLGPAEEELASEITQKISKLRADLLESRAKLYGLLLQVK
ncbi:hypothetical protein [Nitrosopumilus sp.]|uniref:hypothetical protein n=1 Tax=Nitrosopumilus sp. TaxID=2024843 RepID=UPI00262D0FF2|nr:hypothetical protein [Nitrosopumilus sp.]